MNEAGISATLNALFVNAIYNVHKEKDEKDNSGPLSRLWTTVHQTDSSGRPILDLDQLALPGAVEHDISLTRRDHDQKEGNCARQEDLVNDLLASSTDKKNITREGLAGLRRRRIATQREDNPDLTYGALQHEMSCGEIALILGVFGDGKSAPYDFIAPFLQEERLPIKEGWKRRWWWTLGLVEVKIIATQVKGLIGLQIK
ncbi:hypothetical protein N0V95_008872 [Ascochyta clinopodiicola]|nr:hypothetical protein N0V95_008872 [Ascochyta clinopodiicola]